MGGGGGWGGGGSAAASAEVRTHIENDPKCEELGWICVPLAVEAYGARA